MYHIGTVARTVTRIQNIYFQNPNWATSLPNTKFIFPKQIFILNICCLSLPMRQKALVLALISVMHKLLCAVYQQLALPAEHLLPGQAAWVALPSVHQSVLLGHYPPAELVMTPIKVKSLAFCLICMSPPPLNTCLKNGPHFTFYTAKAQMQFSTGVSLRSCVTEV